MKAGRTADFAEAPKTFTRALADAAQVYGQGDQAFRAAYAEFKRTFEKRGGYRIRKRVSAPGDSNP
jgi:hypothetical protein